LSSALLLATCKKKRQIYLLSLGAAAFLAAALSYALLPRPELQTFTTYSSALFDNKGRLLKLSLAEDDRYRLYQPLNTIAPTLLKATILYEDQHFYQHSGADFISLFRAFWQTYLLGERRIGASTIAMQVARLRWQIPSHTIAGKIEQILRAVQLSHHYSKQEILQAYFNMAPYGGNIEGIAAASLIYFNKLPDDLSFPEILTLAVIPQNPNKRNPSTTKGYQELQAARLNLFQRWLLAHPQDREKQKYLEMPLNVRSVKDLPKEAPHFTQFILNRQSRWQHGMVNTSLDLSLQRKIEQIMGNYIASKSTIGINNAAVLLLNYQTMEIEAMVGSADFYDDTLPGQVNGTTAKRSPGSTLKPFVYGLAIDEGVIHPMSLLKDSPHQFGGFTPENYDKKFLGPILAKDALIQSRNVPAVQLQSQLKQRSLYHFLQAAGVTELQEENFYGLALSLGGGELTMVELVHLYSALANKGILHPIKSTNQELTSTRSKRVLSAEASFLLLDILKDNPAPDALVIDADTLMKNDIAWKTGTSWAFRDAWAIGVSGPYVLAVWIGNFNSKGNNAFVGRSAAGPLFFSIFDAISPERWHVEDNFSRETLNLKKIAVCARTGDLYSKNCPTPVSAWFIPGVSPIKVSNIYRSIPIENSTGLRSCNNRSQDTHMQTFEFWPSDFIHIFKQAGISLKTPPAYSSACSLDQKASSGKNPIITSPQTNIEYLIDSTDAAQSRVVFSAIVDPDVEKVFWFVNGKYEGSSKGDKAFIWQAYSGHFLVTAVDDSGRASSKKIVVVHIN